MLIDLALNLITSLIILHESIVDVSNEILIKSLSYFMLKSSLVNVITTIYDLHCILLKKAN